MNPAGETDERFRFARKVVRELTPMLRKEPQDPSFDLVLEGGHTKLRIDEILLDVAPDEPEVVIIFRDIAEPERLCPFRIEASVSGGEDAYVEAALIWANFIESVEGGNSARIRKTDR